MASCSRSTSSAPSTGRFCSVTETSRGRRCRSKLWCGQANAAKYAELLTEFEAWEHEPTVAELDGFAAGVEAADR